MKLCINKNMHNIHIDLLQSISLKGNGSQAYKHYCIKLFFNILTLCILLSISVTISQLSHSLYIHAQKFNGLSVPQEWLHIHTLTDTHTNTHTNSHTHTQTHIHTHKLTHTHTHTNSHSQTHTLTDTHTNTQTHTHKLTDTHTLTHTHTHTNSHTHTQTHRHTHTHTHTQNDYCYPCTCAPRVN